MLTHSLREVSKTMWKIMSRLFGWEYIWVKYDDVYNKVVRVTAKPNGDLFGKIGMWEFCITPDGNIKCKGHSDVTFAPLTWDYEEET